MGEDQVLLPYMEVVELIALDKEKNRNLTTHLQYLCKRSFF